MGDFINVIAPLGGFGGKKTKEVRSFWNEN
jgi:hypothetical protein